MKKRNGFTLVELLAVIVILAVIILVAINAVLPQMDKARRNSFADEAMNYAKAAETRYVAENADDDATVTNGTVTTGICYELKDLHGEYVSKNDGSYSGVVILKKVDVNSNLFYKYVYLASNKFAYNSTTAGESLTTAKAIGKISGKSISDGNVNSLTYKNCCDFERAAEGYNKGANADCTLYPQS